jgi:hypothetical protein
VRGLLNERMTQEMLALIGRLKTMASLQRQSKRSTATEARAASEVECKLEEWERELQAQTPEPTEAKAA